MSKHGPTTQGEVIAVESLGPKVKKITIKNPNLIGFNFIPGLRIPIEVAPELFRDYSISKIDRITGTMETYAFIHNNGPGSILMDKLNLGDQITYLGPIRGTKLDITVGKALLIGDETSIAAIISYLELAPKETEVRGLIEIDESAYEHLIKLDERLEFVERTNKYGEATEVWLKSQIEFAPETHAFITGQDNSIKRIKEILMDDFQISELNVHVTRHWFEGKPLR